MHIALIGATGFIGSALLQEALGRKHTVLALAAHPEKLAAHPGMRAQKLDVMDPAADVFAYYMQGIGNIIAAAKRVRARRLLVVGGAGSLEVAPQACRRSMRLASRMPIALRQRARASRWPCCGRTTA
jgi:putative NADH-flavin reductase